MAIEDGVHAMIHKITGPWPAEEMTDGETVDHARGRVKWARLLPNDSMPRIVDGMEAACRIERFVLKKLEETVGLILQPAAMALVLSPRRRIDGHTSHCQDGLSMEPDPAPDASNKIGHFMAADKGECPDLPATPAPARTFWRA
jgi:hypothetical protein